MYDYDIKGTHKLTEDETRELVLKIQKEKDVEKRSVMIEELIVDNISFIYHMSKVFFLSTKFRLNNSVTINDLTSAGIKGMIDSIAMFDPEKNRNYILFAKFYVHREMRREISGGIVHVPYNRCLEIEKLLKAIDKCGTKDTKVLARELGISEQKVSFTLHSEIPYVDSFDRKTGHQHRFERDDMTLLEMFDEQNSMDNDDSIDDEMKSVIRNAVMELPGKSRDVITMYYGLDGRKKKITLEEIGKKLGISRERVRQLMQASMPVLRKKIEMQIN